MRRRFEEQLSQLNTELTEMGALCEQIIAMAAKALTEGDMSLKEKIVTLEEEIDQKEYDIEALCLKILLQQQPVARDLRQISAALKMITDMERIGDQALDIAEILEFTTAQNGENCDSILKMARAAIKMVTDSVDAYINRDITLAQSVIKQDDEVDEYFVKTKNSLIKMIAQTPNEGEYAIDLLMISKYFERIGDHATNIAEWVVFSVTGVHKEVS